MSTGPTTKQQWCVETRGVIGGRARRGPETRVEQMAMPDPKSVALNVRMIKLKSQIDDLNKLAPDKAATLLVKLEIQQRSLSAGNLDTIETPLAQLELVTSQLLERAKPKLPTTPPSRTPPIKPPTTTPATLPSSGPSSRPLPPTPKTLSPTPPTRTPPPVPPKPVSAPYLEKLIKAEQNKMEVIVLIGGGAPANALNVRLTAINTDFADVAKHSSCLDRIKVIGPEIDTLMTQLEANRVAAAKIKVTELANAPVDGSRGEALKRQVDATTATKRTELTALLKAGTENQDQNIHRDVLGGLAQSKDEQYNKKVKEPCDSALAAVAAALENKSNPVTSALTKRLELLLVQLDEQRAHYADTTGIADRAMITQRKNKVDAIDKRKLALKACLDKVSEIVKVKENTEQAGRDARRSELEADGTLAAVSTLAKNLKAQRATSPEEAKANAKNLLKILTNADPVTRQVLALELSDMPDQLTQILTSTEGALPDALLDDIVKGSDGPKLGALSDGLIHAEISKATNDDNGKASALRSKTPAPALSTRYLKKGPDTRKFIDKSVNPALQRIADTTEDLELDPKKLIPNYNPDSKDSQKKLAGMKKAREKKADKHKELARETLDEIAGTKVPPEVAKICATIYDEAMVKFGDEQNALALVGGQMMLRMIGPALAEAQTDPTMSAEQKRTLNLQSKILQNMSNGQPISRKEKEYDVFDDLFVGPDGGPSPEVLKMQELFKRSVKEGKREKITFDAVLKKDAARTIFQEFMVKDYEPNVVPFWELVRNGVPGIPSAVYAKYIAATGDSQQNLDGDLFRAFTAAQVAGDWTQAPWAAAGEFAIFAVSNDKFQRFKKDEPLWNRACATFGC